MDPVDVVAEAAQHPVPTVVLGDRLVVLVPLCPRVRHRERGVTVP